MKSSQTTCARINTKTPLWRFREIMRGIFTKRSSHGAGVARGIFDLIFTVVFGYFVCAIACPAVCILLSFAKEDFTTLGPRVIDNPSLLLGGWNNVAAIEQTGIENVATILYVAGIVITGVFAFYVFFLQDARMGKNALGMPRGIKRGEYGDGGVEENQIVLASITRTIDPRKSFDHAGLPVGYSMLLHRYYMSGVSNHTVTIAGPGVGKTTRYILQQTYLHIIAKQDSAVIFDPKGEIYGLTGQFARDCGNRVIVWDFDNWKRSELYNCISEVHTVFAANWKRYNTLIRQAANAVLVGEDEQAHSLSKQAEMARVEAFTTANTMAGSLAHALIPETVKSDVYWTPSARSFFHAVVGGVATYTQDQWVGKRKAPYEPTPEQRTLKTIAYLIDQTTKWDKNEGKIELTDFFDGLGAENPFSRKYAQIRNAEGANLSSLISSLNNYLVETSSPANDMIGYGMPDGYENLERIGEQKTIVYIVVSTESAEKKVMLPIITKQIYDALIRCTKHHGGCLPYMTHFLMEELGSMSLIGDFEEFLRTGRGYGIRIHAVLQSENQWKSMYGADHEKTIKNSINCHNYVSITDAQDAENLSKEIGECTISASSESVRGGLLNVGQVSVTHRHEKIRAVPAEKIEGWNPDWGSFVRMDKLYENKFLNKILFHRHTARISIFPTTSPKFMPGSCEMGIETESKAIAVREIADLEDRSAMRREIPSWNPFNKSEKDHEEIIASLKDKSAVGLATSKDITKVVKSEALNSLPATFQTWAYNAGVADAQTVLEKMGDIHTKEEVMRAYKRADKQRANEISNANRTVGLMIANLPFVLPEQSRLDEQAYAKKRSRVQAIWREGVFDTLNSAAGIRKEERNATKKEAGGQHRMDSTTRKR